MENYLNGLKRHAPVAKVILSQPTSSVPSANRIGITDAPITLDTHRWALNSLNFLGYYALDVEIMVQGDPRVNFCTFSNYFGYSWRLNFMGTTGKTIDVIPQVPKISHGPPGEFGTPKVRQNASYFTQDLLTGSFVSLWKLDHETWHVELNCK